MFDLKRPSWNPSSGMKTEDFELGDRVMVVCKCQDFTFFPGDQLGTIVRLTGNKFLPFIVAFDEPMHYKDGFILTKFNFEAEDLELVERLDWMSTLMDAVEESRP